MMTMGTLTMNANSETKVVQGVDWTRWRQRLAKGWRKSCEVANAVFNIFFKPCAAQDQVEKARLQEMQLRRYMNIL